MRKTGVSSTLTVYFDGQFWVGVIERVKDGGLSALSKAEKSASRSVGVTEGHVTACRFMGKSKYHRQRERRGRKALARAKAGSDS